LLATQDNALSAEKIRAYFAGAWPHYEAPGNGLRNLPDRNELCPLLVFEDFGTTGLQGDTTQWHDKPGEKNPFFYFFRAEGRSAKSEEDRGRWGLGKYAFPRMSRVSSFCGLTLRADDGRRLLMAQTVLKSHELDGVYYSPDGCFGEQGRNGLILPCEDQPFITKFCEDFGLQRKKEPGLSVVIPWLWEEDVSRDSVIEAVVRGYFQPILTGSLAVTVETPKERVDINHETRAGRRFGGTADRRLALFLRAAQLSYLARLASSSSASSSSGGESIAGREETVSTRNASHVDRRCRRAFL
jgi:hypothetical protein